MRQDLVLVRVVTVLVMAALYFTNSSNVSLPVTVTKARLSKQPSN